MSHRPIHSQPRLTTADGSREFACFPAAILAFVIDDLDRFLLLSHPARKGGWEIVNGAIDEGESPVEALLREVAEEAGPEVRIRPIGIAHTFLYRYDSAVQAMFSIAYVAQYSSGPITPGSDMAMSEHRWASLAEIESGAVTVIIPAQAWLFRRALAVSRMFRDDTVDLEPWRPLSSKGPPAVDRVLAAILFTDFVESTRTAARVGDAEWAKLLKRHELLAHQTIDVAGGRVVKQTGDGVLALFGSATAAVTAAKSLQREAFSLGILLRAGIHVGEVQLSALDVSGRAVIAAARICATAGPGELLLSGTAAELVAGSTVRVGEARTVTLKGLGDIDVYLAHS